MDIDGLKTKVLIQQYQRLGVSQRDLLLVPQHVGVPNKSALFIPVWRSKKPEGRDYNEKPRQQSLGAMVRQINQVDS